jgi:hypothetical protein
MDNDKNELKELNRFVIQYILRLYGNRDIEGLRQMGISFEDARQLSELSLSDSIRLESFNAPIARVLIAEHIPKILDYIRLESTKDKLIDELILMEASQPMLMELAGMETREFQHRRRDLGLPKAKAGRPALLNDQEATAVHHAWHEYCHEPNVLQRYLYIGIAVKAALGRGVPLSQIWYHLRTQH